MFDHDPDFLPVVGDSVTLGDETDCVVPAGTYTVTHVNDDGSFLVGGNTAGWPRRIVARVHYFR